jgi:hypothetical protein
MTKSRAIVRLLLALMAVGLVGVGHLLNSRAPQWVGVLILVAAWIWTAFVLRAQRGTSN